MKISILATLMMSLLSFSSMANETECDDITLLGTSKTGEISVEFKRFESGRTITDESKSDLLAGDDFISVVLPVAPNDDLTWPEANKINNKPFKVVHTEIFGSGVDASGVKFFELDVRIQIPQDIANEFNGGINEALVVCTEVVNSCSGMDC